MSLKFQPLSYDRLSEALGLIKETFPTHLDHVTKVYNVSLEKNQSDEYWKTRRILDYWVAIDDKNAVVALTGFYQLVEHAADEIWLGWYCVSPAERGKGFGRETLEWTIAEARNRGYKLLRLWTTTDPNEAAAQKLYDSLGLMVYKTEPSETPNETVMYRELKL